MVVGGVIGVLAKRMGERRILNSPNGLAYLWLLPTLSMVFKSYDRPSSSPGPRNFTPIVGVKWVGVPRYPRSSLRLPHLGVFTCLTVADLLLEDQPCCSLRVVVLWHVPTMYASR